MSTAAQTIQKIIQEAELIPGKSLPLPLITYGESA
jgi:cell division protein FtsW (lipid II flippase)